jgi:endonuclease YncB( thermonuclease family)
VREVKPRPAHTVKEDAEATPRREVDVRRAPGAEAPSRTAAVSPRPTRSATPGAGILSGAAQPAGATALTVGRSTIRLFGVRPPDGGEACAGAPCAERAKTLLAERVRRSGSVTCEVPARPGAAICRDKDGVDLGGFLVSEGYARADTGQSFEYVSAEASARSARRGLWQSR